VPFSSTSRGLTPSPITHDVDGIRCSQASPSTRGCVPASRSRRRYARRNVFLRHFFRVVAVTCHGQARGEDTVWCSCTTLEVAVDASHHAPFNRSRAVWLQLEPFCVAGCIGASDGGPTKDGALFSRAPARK